ncbi:MAG: F0F1 ATP synthase subunit A [Alphaproteobacteria bacterium]|nr:F0F1 ATP synthase subunit A [Alphaproteobacteria bacterium]MDD9919398.1 F0F1 ATP synthase subunit A [Alphaproteobacteria bacterium]
MSANPLHQFEIHKIYDLQVAGFDLSVTNHTMWLFIGVGLVSLLMLWGSRRAQLVPNRMQSFVEVTIDFIRTLTKETAGESALRFLPFIATLFLFLAAANVIGMVPGSFTATSQMLTTGFMALGVFMIVIGVGFYVQGLKFFKLFYPEGTPWWLAPLIVLLEVISFFARPATLALRLAANMMAGHILLKVFASFVIMLMVVLPPLALVPLLINVALTGLEIGVALLQAYIFTILTCVYLHDALHGH